MTEPRRREEDLGSENRAHQYHAVGGAAQGAEHRAEERRVAEPEPFAPPTTAPITTAAPSARRRRATRRRVPARIVSMSCTARHLPIRPGRPASAADGGIVRKPSAGSRGLQVDDHASNVEGCSDGRSPPLPRGSDPAWITLSTAKTSSAFGRAVPMAAKARSSLSPLRRGTNGPDSPQDPRNQRASNT